MKTIRVLCVCLAAVMLFSLSALAVDFTPSAERKPAPELIDYTASEEHATHGKELLVTPLAHLYDENIELHEDIERSLEEAKHELENLVWHDMVHDFHEHWDRVTGGAPIENAVVSDIFDVRFLCELGNENEKPEDDTTVARSFGNTAGITLMSASFGVYSFVADDEDGADLDPEVRNALTVLDWEANGEEITMRLKVQGLTADDSFLIISRCSEADEWDDTKFSMSEDGILTITEKTMSAFAIVRDSGKDPVVDPDDPDSPQTGVPAYLTPAIAGAVVFTALAAVCVKKIVKREEA